MASELEAVVRKLFAALDRKDFAGILREIVNEAQGVDEISRRWMLSGASRKFRAR